MEAKKPLYELTIVLLLNPENSHCKHDLLHLTICDKAAALIVV
jgi:hypothetical protein